MHLEATIADLLVGLLHDNNGQMHASMCCEHLYALEPAYKPLIKRLGGIKGLCSRHPERMHFVGNAGGGVVHIGSEKKHISPKQQIREAHMCREPHIYGAPHFPAIIQDQTADSKQYPIRPGEPDCAFFIKSGTCKFGETCKFNHPPVVGSAGGARLFLVNKRLSDEDTTPSATSALHKQLPLNTCQRLYCELPIQHAELNTVDVTLISHTHGRQRRAERSIGRVDLQAAVKHGNCEPASPGQRGEQRWRYEYNGVVYITDASSKHEITSWRLDGKDEIKDRDSHIYGTHIVLVVDNSGSMRSNDVPGYRSRTDAVYASLLRDLV